MTFGPDPRYIGASTPLAPHLQQGFTPIHEANCDVRIRVVRTGDLVCGVARVDTSYGPVVLTAKMPCSLVSRMTGLLGPACELAAARAVRKDLTAQVKELPTESSSKAVQEAAMIRDQVGANMPQGHMAYATLRRRAAKGDKKASALLGMVLSADPRSGAPIFGAAAPPSFARTANIIAPRRPMTAAELARIRLALTNAVKAIPAWRLSAAAKR